MSESYESTIIPRRRKSTNIVAKKMFVYSTGEWRMEEISSKNNYSKFASQIHGGKKRKMMLESMKHWSLCYLLQLQNRFSLNRSRSSNCSNSIFFDYVNYFGTKAWEASLADILAFACWWIISESRLHEQKLFLRICMNKRKHDDWDRCELGGRQEVGNLQHQLLRLRFAPTQVYGSSSSLHELRVGLEANQVFGLVTK